MYSLFLQGDLDNYEFAYHVDETDSKYGQVEAKDESGVVSFQKKISISSHNLAFLYRLDSTNWPSPTGTRGW